MTHTMKMDVSHGGKYPVTVVTQWTDDDKEARRLLSENLGNAACIFTRVAVDGVLGKFRVIAWVRRSAV